MSLDCLGTFYFYMHVLFDQDTFDQVPLKIEDLQVKEPLTFDVSFWY